jgi:hypothetical protein
MKNLFIIITLALTAGCTKKADIELPRREPKLVVTCFISPQEQYITAVVRSSVPKYTSYSPYNKKGQLNTDIFNAVITLYDGTKEVTVPLQADSMYRLDATLYPIVAGRTYTLNVSTPDGKKVSAVTTVPDDSVQVEFKDVLFRSNTATTVDFDLGIAINDVPSKTTFVAVYAKTGIMTRTSFKYVEYHEEDDMVFMNTDEKMTKSIYYGTLSKFANAEDSVLYVQPLFFALNCSRDFYYYNQSVSTSAGIGGDPFAEPALIYSNITGGFGCFGAYTQTMRGKYIR